jgi:saccharopine dehydrogenase-like NADP-dependent oxidoreductase
MKSLLDQGLFNKDRIKETSNNLFKDWKLEKNEEEFTVLDINIYGDSKNIHYHIYDEFNQETTSSSMARTTGYTATATINMLCNNLWTEKGVYPHEIIGSKKECYNFIINYLQEKDINIDIKHY